VEHFIVPRDTEKPPQAARCQERQNPPGEIRKQQYQDLILEGNAIENVKSYKLLGVHVTETLKWDVHITAVLHKASKRIHFLKQLVTRMVQLPATAAIEYVAAGHFFPGGLLPGGDFCPGGLCPFPPSSMRICTV